MKKNLSSLPLIFIIALCIILANYNFKANERIKVLQRENEVLKLEADNLKAQINMQNQISDKHNETHKKDWDFISNKSDNEDLSKSENIIDFIPIKGEYSVSQQFSEKHPATDFAVAVGTEILAAARGKVNASYTDDYFGKVLELVHNNGFSSKYGHLAKRFVKENETVHKGQIIALSGNTGNSSAPHLHLEISQYGINKNIFDYIKRRD